MTWREIERIIRKETFDVIVEPRWHRNKYWIRKKPAYFEISSNQFEKLLEGGYIDPDYRVERIKEAERLIYHGR